MANLGDCDQWAPQLGRISHLLRHLAQQRYCGFLHHRSINGLVVSMSLRESENRDLKKLAEWHLEQAKKCRNVEQVGERDFHVWAATLVSVTKAYR